MAKSQSIIRSERFIMHYQIEALCESLQFCIQTNSQPGKKTFVLLDKLNQDTLELTDGRCITPNLSVTENDSIADWLACANNMRAISLAFL